MKNTFTNSTFWNYQERIKRFGEEKMKSIYALLLVGILWNTTIQAQYSSNNLPSTDLQTLCKTISNEKKLVGLGESTHGTKEFTLLRSEIVKTLVTSYNYKVFILEADYAPCKKINEYLQTGTGNVEQLMLELRLWPWIHEDFLNLLVWLKDYNLNNPTQRVRFYGMDSQLSKLHAQKDSILLKYPDQGDQLFSIVEGNDNPKKKLNDLRRLSDQFEEASNTVDLLLHYYILCQINKLSQSSIKDPNIRDKNMAQFVQLIHKHDSSNVLIWAHNGHISKQGPSIRERTALGHHLAAIYGEAYAAIGLDFQEGEFLAVDYDNITERKIKTFSLKPTQKTLASEIDFAGKPFLVVPTHSLDGLHYINAIGAIYVAQPEKTNSFYSKIEKEKEYDYLILSKKSNPIKLLPQYLNR